MKFYLIDCKSNKDYELAKKKLGITHNSIMLNRFSNKDRLYEKLVKLRGTIYYTRLINCKPISKIIPDLYVWCYQDKLIAEYDKLKIELDSLFTSKTMRSIYLSFEDSIILEKGNDKLILKVESIEMFKNFKFLMLANLGINVSTSITKFLYTEKLEYREYDISFVNRITKLLQKEKGENIEKLLQEHRKN